MSTYRFCGSKTEVGEIALKKFGQSCELSDELAKDVILGGGCIVPAADFDAIGFTEQELSIYADPTSHPQAHAVFLSKKKKAILACHDIRTRLEAGGSIQMPRASVDVEAPLKSAPVDAK